MLEISTLTEAEEPEYAGWLQGLDAMVYYSPAFHRFLRAAVGGELRVFVARRDGTLVGALPLLRRSAAGLGAIVNSLPWYGSHGGCVLADHADEPARRALIDAYRSEIASPDVLTATLILSPAENAARSTYDEIVAPRTHDHRIGQITRLPEPGPDLDRRLKGVLLQKTRNLVRKACKQGFEEAISDEGWAWDFLMQTHEQNMAAIGGRAKPREHFQALRAEIPPDMRRLSVALHGTAPVAAMLLVRFARTVEYVTPVIRHEYRSLQPLSFLLWRGLLDAATGGHRWWNWGGTWLGQESLHHFKAGWGAADRPYTYLVSLSATHADQLRARRNEILSAFPFYYVYPFRELDRDSAQQA